MKVQKFSRKVALALVMLGIAITVTLGNVGSAQAAGSDDKVESKADTQITAYANSYTTSTPGMDSNHQNLNPVNSGYYDLDHN